MTRLLVLLVGVLFGALESGVLAQDGGSLSYPRALERLESLVASLNGSLHETRADLHEVRLSLNQTKKTLGEVRGEKESLKLALVETRNELTVTKSLYQQAIDEIRAAQDSGRVEAQKSDRRLKRIGRKVHNLGKQLSERISAIENEQLPRQLNELTRDFRRLEDENLPRRVNQVLIKLVNVEFWHNSSTDQFKEEQRQLQGEIQSLDTELQSTQTMTANQQESIDRLTTRVTQQGQSVNQLSDSVTDQEERLDKLTSTVEKQGTGIARLKEDIQIRIGEYLMHVCIF